MYNKMPNSTKQYVISVESKQTLKEVGAHGE